MLYVSIEVNDFIASISNLDDLGKSFFLQMLLDCVRNNGALSKTIIHALRSRDKSNTLDVIIDEFCVTDSSGKISMPYADSLISQAIARSAKAKKAVMAREQYKKEFISSDDLEINTRSSNDHPKDKREKIKDNNIYPPTPQEGGDACDDTQGVNVRVSRKASKACNPNDCPEGVEPQTWADYLTVRKAKKAPMTHTALAKLQSEANKANMSLQSVIAMCAEKNWQGFSASWEHEKRDRQVAATEDRSQSYRKNNRDNQASAILSQTTQSVRSPAADDYNPYRSYVPSYLRPENVPSARKIDTVDDNFAEKPKTKLALLAERAARELPPKDTAITEQEKKLTTISKEKTEALGITS